MRVYFSGIGGVGIGPLAEIAADAGYEVCGSDREAGLMTAELEQRGVKISFDQSGEFLHSEHAKAPFNWLVYTSALPADHPELVLARQLGIHTSKRDEFLARLIDDKDLKLIAIAGTHGKTTTTGMMVWLLKQLGRPVSYSIGTTLSWGPSGQYVPGSEYFVYECDEFDRNFLHFRPYISLITSVEHDHPDTYPTAEEYYAAFRQFGEQSRQVVTWRENAKVLNGQNVTFLDEANAQLTLAGEHNRKNATLVMKAADIVVMPDTDTAQISNLLNTFPGTNRRFEKLADNLYSDYGHTPTEIAATLQMARELSDQVVLIYQPHQNIRQHEIRQQYTDAIFRDAEAVYWLPTYLSREDPSLEILTPEQLTSGLSGVHSAEMNDELWRVIQSARGSGKLVLCMGAGTIDGWVRGRLQTS